MDVRDAAAEYRIEPLPDLGADEVPPGYKRTEVGVIPEDWSLALLPALAWFQEGPGVRNYQFTSSGVKLFNGTNIEFGRITLDTTERYVAAREAYGAYRHFLADPGDIVIACSGVSVDRFDEKVAVLSDADLPLCMNTSTMRFKVFRAQVDGRYFIHFLRSRCFKNQIGGTATGSAQLNFGPAHVSAVNVPLPALAEQEAIAEALSDADALIESLQQLITKQHAIKQGAMQTLLAGHQRLPGFSGEWQIKRLDELADVRSGGTPSTTRPEYWDGDVLWCTPTDITALGGHKYLSETARKITLLGVKASSAELIPAQSIVMTSRATIGACAINVAQVTTNQGFKNLVPHGGVDVEFLYYLLCTQTAGLVSLCGGSTFLEVSKKQVAAYEVRVPAATAEQTAIAAVLSDMDAAIDALEARLAKTRALKAGMMQQLLTGRIRLPLDRAA